MNLELKEYKAGETIFEAGDAGDVAYLLESGRIEISRMSNGKKLIFGEVKPGTVFGEMAMISELPRMATAIATEDAKCLVIPSAMFDLEMKNASKLMRGMLVTFIKNVRDLSDNLEKVRSVLIGGSDQLS